MAADERRQLARAAHQLKGASANLYAETLRSLCADLVYAALRSPATNAVWSRSSAQAIRASLLARATTTVLPCARLSNPRSQLPSGVGVLDSDGRAARAPWMMSLRRYLLPRLVIPSSLGLPPVVAWRGTSPIHFPLRG